MRRAGKGRAGGRKITSYEMLNKRKEGPKKHLPMVHTSNPASAKQERQTFVSSRPARATL